MNNKVLTKEKWEASPFTKKEKIHTQLYETSFSASTAIAVEIADMIREKQSLDEFCVLGLATGSSPKSVYKELVRLHKEEGLSFENVITFNLDEYYPMDPNALQSYVKFMHEQLFDHIDIKPENIIFNKKNMYPKLTNFCISDYIQNVGEL